jgi:hypothetical protein
MFTRCIGTRRLAALAILASSITIVSPAVAQQPRPEQIETIRQACRSDFVSHCSSIQPGGPEALQCLQRNAAQLSPACSSAINAAAPSSDQSRPETATPQPQRAQAIAQDQLSAMRGACTLNDFMSHCSWIEPSSPELLQCLRANAAQLSPACQTAVSASPTATPTPVSVPVVATTSPPADVAQPAFAPAAPHPPVTAKRPSAKQMSAIRSACRSDFISRCSGVQPGGSAALQCLERHKGELSQPCQGAIAALGGTATGANVGEATAPASGAQPTATESFPVRRLQPREALAILRACSADSRNLCAGTPRGGGGLIACLASNASQLGPQCRTALAAARN